MACASHFAHSDVSDNVSAFPPRNYWRGSRLQRKDHVRALLQSETIYLTFPKYEHDWQRSDGTSPTWEDPADNPSIQDAVNDWDIKRIANLPDNPDVKLWGTTDIVNTRTRLRKQGYEEPTEQEMAGLQAHGDALVRRMEELMVASKEAYPDLFPQNSSSSSKTRASTTASRRPVQAGPSRVNINAEAGPSLLGPPLQPPVSRLNNRRLPSLSRRSLLTTQPKRRSLRRRATIDDDDDDHAFRKCACGTLLPPPDVYQLAVCDTCRSPAKRDGVRKHDHRSTRGTSRGWGSEASIVPGSSVASTSASGHGRELRGWKDGKDVEVSNREGEVPESRKSLRLQVESAWTALAQGCDGEDDSSADIMNYSPRAPGSLQLRMSASAKWDFWYKILKVSKHPFSFKKVNSRKVLDFEELRTLERKEI
ncbi:hypothetical protein B0H14DRAFT_2602038 [Mycena olivaceomarginata]|nr:hypothetical protein B0H14DRAFT_2602038 [Mycena olivaceomarginata]